MGEHELAHMGLPEYVAPITRATLFKEKLVFLTFSVLVANPKKLLYVCGLLNREKRTKEKSGTLRTTGRM